MAPNPARSRAEHNFILQQGLQNPSAETRSAAYAALLFQPRIVGAVILAGVVLQSAVVFLGLAAVLWWSALLPSWNPFDALHNATAGRRTGAVLLGPAPAPRRFAQAMAGTFALAIGGFLSRGWGGAALTLEVLFLIALAALVFGRFCLGSFIFHVLGGRRAFALCTLPWARGL